MKIAEKLYTQGYISYPRTETNIFPKELNLQPLVEMQTADQSWGNFARRVLDQGINPRQGKKTDQAHPPIHPTKYVSLAQLSGDNERKIYEFVVRHFLACLSQDAQGYETVVEINIADEEFVASGLQIVARNYLEVYPYDKWSDRSLPQFEEGQKFQPTSIRMDEGQTSPPQLLTEADLIALMEKHGIGTDATHAEHIETIKSRSYVGVQAGDGRFLPCSLGMGLVQGYDDIGITLSKPNLRADLEADLKRICDGVRNPKDVLKEQIDRYRAAFIQVAAQLEKIDQALSTYINEQPREARTLHAGSDGQPAAKYCTCPQCQLDMILRRKKGDQNQVGGFFMSCMGYPQCKSAIWLPNTVRAVEMDPRTCPTCPSRPHLLRMTFVEGSYAPLYPDVYTGCIGGCDSNLNQALGIRSPSAAPATSSTQSNGNGSSYPAPRPTSTNSAAPWNGQRSAAPRPPPAAPAPPMNRSSDAEDSSIVCSCNEPAVLLTVMSCWLFRLRVIELLVVAGSQGREQQRSSVLQMRQEPRTRQLRFLPLVRCSCLQRRSTTSSQAPSASSSAG
jgi:DNA topoisomerase III